jgi:hypothetical protein
MKHAISSEALQSLDREGAEAFDFLKTIRLLTRAALNKATADQVRIPGRHFRCTGRRNWRQPDIRSSTQVEYLNKDIRSRQRKLDKDLAVPYLDPLCEIPISQT